MNSREEMIEELLKKPALGPDDKFRFWCTACGECCSHTEGVILEPGDIYRASKYMGITPKEFFEEYCEWYIGPDSCFPLIVPKTVGITRDCIFLKDRKCRIHKAKPSVCEIYPLGRMIQMDDDEPKVIYRLQSVRCGKMCRESTVREWLSRTGIEKSEEYFLEFHNMLTKVTPPLRKLFLGDKYNKLLDFTAKMLIGMVYLDYDMDGEFVPQFKKNTEEALKMIREIDEIIEKTVGQGSSVT